MDRGLFWVVLLVVIVVGLVVLYFTARVREKVTSDGGSQLLSVLKDFGDLAAKNIQIRLIAGDVVVHLGSNSSRMADRAISCVVFIMTTLRGT
jgi:hypothetical protein